jgi:hypothetical protein
MCAAVAGSYIGGLLGVVALLADSMVKHFV